MSQPPHAAPPASAGLARVSTVEALVIAIRERVLRGHEAPGEALREKELVERYQVSRHSLRTAIQVLVSEGLLRHEPHRGVFVPQITEDDVRDIFRVRTLLELEAAHAFAKTRRSPDSARQAADALDALGPGASWDEIMVADVRFHAALVDAAGSRRMSRIYHSLTGELQLCLRPVREIFAEHTGGVHHDLLNAIDTGDVPAVDVAFGDHLDGSLRKVLARMTA